MPDESPALGALNIGRIRCVSIAIRQEGLLQLVNHSDGATNIVGRGHRLQARFPAGPDCR